MEGAAVLFGHTACEMKCICLLQIFLQITLHGATQAQDPELLVIYPSNGIFKEGEKLKLQCRYSVRLACIYWFKDAIRISACSNYIYEVLLDSNSGGSYQCGVVFSRWQKSKLVDVVTIASDMKLSLEVTPKATLLGENITMNCFVPAGKWTGPKHFLWYRNEELIARNNKCQYTIRRAKRSDGASYRCELQIKYRKWISAGVDVTITGIAVSKPGLTIHPGKELMNGNTASLLCSVSNGSTPIAYIFYKDSDIELYREVSDLTEITYKLSNVNKSTEGRYSCSVTNEVTEHPVRSEFVAVAVAAAVIVQSYTTTITASVLAPFLIAPLVVLILYKQRNKKKDNSSSFSQPQGESIGNETLPSSEQQSPSNFMRAFVGSAANTDTGADVFGGKRLRKSDSSAYCVTYSTLNHTKTEARSKAKQMEEGDSRDAYVYENIPRK